MIDPNISAAVMSPELSEQLKRGLLDHAAVWQILAKIPDTEIALAEVEKTVGSQALPIVKRLLELAEIIASMTRAQLSKAWGRLELIRQHIESVKNAPEKSQPAAYREMISTLTSQGILPPASEEIPVEYPGDEILSLCEQSFRATSQLVEGCYRVLANAESIVLGHPAGGIQ